MQFRINSIIELTDDVKQKKYLEMFISFMERWSAFLLDLARDIGLENKQMGLPIIQSVDNNLRIISGIIGKFNKVDLKKTHRIQLNTLSWYFQKVDKVDSSFLFNIEKVLETLLIEIRDNLIAKVFDVEYPIDLYLRLVQQHFEKVSDGYGYNHPRVIEKLVCLGLILHKYKQEKNVDVIVAKIDELNRKYLELNKDYFELKKKETNVMGPNETQLCKEIYDLKNDLFSYNSGMLMDIKLILQQEITKDVWDSFVDKIQFCKGVEYKTVSYF